MKKSIESFFKLKRKLIEVFKGALRLGSLILIGVYRTIGSPLLGGCCRFTPSCSEFALQCYHDHSFLHATKLTLARLFKCRPGGPSGFDPAPQRGEIINGPK